MTEPETDTSSGWPTEKKDYELYNELGKGSTAQVYTTLCKPKNVYVAAKVIDLDETKADLEEIKTELIFMKSCNHPNLVKYHTSFVHHQQLWIIMELMDRGSVFDLLQKRALTTPPTSPLLDEVAIATILKSVIQGLDYLHSEQKLHRDVKSGNILLNKSGEVKLADFGVSAFLGDDAMEALERTAERLPKKKSTTNAAIKNSLKRSTFVGTPCWMAPEVMEQMGYNEKADIWSLGITAIELVTGRVPYSDMDVLQIMSKILREEPPTLESTAQGLGKSLGHKFKALSKFITRCLNKDPAQRPSASELLKSDLIKKAKDKNYVLRTLLQKETSKKPQKTEMDETTKQGRFRVSAWDFEMEQVKADAKVDESSPLTNGDASKTVDPTAGSTADASELDNAEPNLIEPAKQSQPETLSQEAEQPEVSKNTPEVETAQQPEETITEEVITEAEESNTEETITREIHFRLRIRQGDDAVYNQIQFTITIPNEQPGQIAEELVQNKLIRALDAHAVAQAMKLLIADSELKSQTFRLFSDDETDIQVPAEGKKIPPNHAQLTLIRNPKKSKSTPPDKPVATTADDVQPTQPDSNNVVSSPPTPSDELAEPPTESTDVLNESSTTLV